MMLRTCVLMAAILLAAVAVNAAPSYDIDEQALLAELEDRPVHSDASLMTLSDLDSDALTLLSTEEKQLLEKDITFNKLNTAPKEGIDIWNVPSERGVYTKPFGTVIGNLAKGASLVIQDYKYEKRGKNEVQWGYGYVSTPVGFGGWAGANACGWFPLKRSFGEEIRQDGTLEKNIPNHPRKCPKVAEAKKLLARSNIFKKGTYTKDGSIVKAVTKQACPAFLNYDPAGAAPCDSAPALPAGAFSGKGAAGTVPAGFAQTTKVDGFGVQFVTKDGKFAMVRYPNLDRANPGHTHFFVDCTCLEFDTAAVAAVNGVSLMEVEAQTQTEEATEQESEQSSESEQELESESEQESEEFPEEFAAMEIHSEAHEVLAAPRRLRRGNYPGWTSMLEIHASQEPAQAEAPRQNLGGAPVAKAAPAPAQAAPAAPASHDPVQKNFPEGPNVKHINLAAGESFAKLRNANVGVKKVHLHVFGKADAEVDEERRLKTMVRRLADKQSDSYKKVNKILFKLKKCSVQANTKECLQKLTDKLEDFKAEHLAPK